MALNEKQKRFCEEYVKTLNATKSAINAGYSPKSAKTQGNKLLLNDEVTKYIQKLQQKIQIRNNITVDMVIQELSKVAFSDIFDYIEVVDGESKVKDISNMKNISALKMINEDIKQTTTGINRVIKFIMHDKIKALELLGKHLGAFNEKIEHSGKVEVIDPFRDFKN